ncbi:DUF3958 family protein [Streptococcus ruminantium]|uniref:DUF3958 family protein n=1 Tax=Streptococcus ruminantium TaxID=1917441 RepID=UPI0012DD560E|nr:DUF3958 family protein [Streptococcus ruminantium]
MDRNDLIAKEKRVTEQLAQVQKDLKTIQERQETLTQLSKDGQRFFQDTLGLLGGSSDYPIFQGLYDEQVSLDKKVKIDIEREQDELQQDYSRLSAQFEELAAARRQLDKEETNGY